MNNKSYLPFPSHCVWGNFIGTWYSYNTAFKDLLFDVLITRMHWPLVLVHNALSQINNNFPSQVSHKTRSEIYFSISKIFKSLSTSGGWHVFQSHYSGSLASQQFNSSRKIYSHKTGRSKRHSGFSSEWPRKCITDEQFWGPERCSFLHTWKWRI